MKKDIYKCEKCGHEINTARRDQGTPHSRIGCVNVPCKGMAMTSWEMVDQSIEPTYIFIKPKDADEWKMIEDELIREINRDFPKITGKKMIKKKNKFMTNILFHIQSGGLVYLPKDVINPKQ